MFVVDLALAWLDMRLQITLEHFNTTVPAIIFIWFQLWLYQCMHHKHVLCISARLFKFGKAKALFNCVCNYICLNLPY